MERVSLGFALGARKEWAHPGALGHSGSPLANAVTALPVFLALPTSVCSSHLPPASIFISLPKVFWSCCETFYLDPWQMRSARKLTPRNRNRQPIIDESWGENTLALPSFRWATTKLCVLQHFPEWPEMVAGWVDTLLPRYTSAALLLHSHFPYLTLCFLAPPNKPFTFKSLPQSLLLRKPKLRRYPNGGVRGIIRKKRGFTILKIINIYLSLDCELLESKDCILIFYSEYLAYTRSSRRIIAYSVSHRIVFDSPTILFSSYYYRVFSWVDWRSNNLNELSKVTQ